MALPTSDLLGRAHLKPMAIDFRSISSFKCVLAYHRNAILSLPFVGNMDLTYEYFTVRHCLSLIFFSPFVRGCLPSPHSSWTSPNSLPRWYPMKQCHLSLSAREVWKAIEYLTSEWSFVVVYKRKSSEDRYTPHTRSLRHPQKT